MNCPSEYSSSKPSKDIILPPVNAEAHLSGGPASHFPTDGRFDRSARHTPFQIALNLVLFLLLILACSSAFAEEENLTVGVSGTVEQVILPGSEMIVKPITDRLNPIVLRIGQVFPHGDSFRYELHYQGMEPGTYNLVDFLTRKDGSPMGDVEPIEVKIHSLLPPGQVIPNPVREVPVDSMGSYTPWAIAVAVIWATGLLCLIFLGRKRRQSSAVKERQQTLGDLIQDRLQAAKDKRLTPGQYAELERLLLTFWRKRLGLEHMTLEQSTKTIRNHKDAGPLVKKLEHWMHSPDNDPTPNAGEDADLAKLIEPYHAMPVELLEGAS